MTVEEEPPDSKKLSSRTERRKEAVKFNTYIIKCGFDKSLNVDVIYKDIIVKNINQRVQQISKGIHKLSILMNIFIRECLEKTTNPLNVNIPSFLTDKDTTFARQMMIGSDDFEKNRKPNPVLLDFLTRNEHLIKSHPFKRFQGDSNSITRACETYLTNYRTYITEVFENKQKAYLYLWCNTNDIEPRFVRVLRYLINGWEIDDKEKEMLLVHVKYHKISRLIDFQRKLLKLESKHDKVEKSWIKKNYETVIVYYSVLSRYFKKHDKKQILLTPICKIKAMFIHIDTDVLNGILNETNIGKFKVADIRTAKNEHFNRLFKIDKLINTSQIAKGFHFTGTVMTDGTALNVIFNRPKLKPSKETELNRNDPNIRIIANDPGRTTLFCGIEYLEDETVKQYSLTRKHFYTVSGAKKATQNVNRWHDENLRHVINQMSQTNSRSTKLDEFLQYVKTIKDNYNALWNEGLKKRYSRQRLNLYSGKKKVYDEFFSNLKSPSDTRTVVVAYGDAGFASASKYELSAPTKTLEKQCARWFKIVKVDEFRTTQLHHQTNEILSKVTEIKQNENQKQIRTVRGLLWYRKTNNVSKFIDRDLNAAKNILRCYRMFPERPHGMNRNDPKQEIPKAHYIYSKQKLLSVVLVNYTSIEHEDLARFSNFFK